MNEKCQVFTPNDYVEELLNSVGYIENLYNKRILENSCGDGNILRSIVRRYIEDSLARGISRECISKGLSRDVFGIEIDEKQYKKCINNLDDILIEYKIENVKWNIKNYDYLQWDQHVEFDYVVGNPPYITYKEIPESERVSLRGDFITCLDGKFDYCYAFIEKSLKHLNGTGKMSYLIPSSIFKTVFGQNLRDYIKPYVVEIKDYTHEKLFDDALVKSAIITISKFGNYKKIRYVNMTTQHTFLVASENLKKKWFFSQKVEKGVDRFGDYFTVSHVVATLCNDAFVLKGECLIEEDYIVHEGMKIEKELIRKTVTPRSLRYNQSESIIFPYEYRDGKIHKYTIEDFETRFPYATAYLNTYRKRLEDRKKDKSAKWFEYGRSQALASINSDKLLMSSVVTNSVAIYKIKKECIPYAGMYITSKNKGHEYDLDYAIKLLTSSRFMDYVKKVGIHVNGNSLRITSKDILDFMFTEV